MHFYKKIQFLFPLMLVAVSPVAAEETSSETQAMKSMQHVLKRAEVVRLLAAEHLNYLEGEGATADVRMMEDGAEVMAFSLICDSAGLDPKMLNRIAAEATMKIALKVETSPIKDRMTQIMGDMRPEDRLNLVADVSSTALMFKIGRRRGLFDALLTDFGTGRFCRGMGGAIKKRYNDLAEFLKDEG
ncbi:MAG: hypothetical protein HWE25_06855 [Alphaproteobacteria bacterium]|nr:hypothetical protein [Alphaproteobacteria bacterium]